MPCQPKKQQPFECPTSCPRLVLSEVSLSRMLTQRDAMKLIKSTAEAVMESLRMLLIILMNQIEVKAPDQEITVQHATSLQSLLANVNAQKDRIEEPSQILKENRSPKRTSSRAGPSPSEIGVLSDHSWELEEEEEIRAATRTPPKKSQPRSQGASTMSHLNHNLIPENNREGQLALTAQALESWGNKRVSWGKHTMGDDSQRCTKNTKATSIGSVHEPRTRPRQCKTSSPTAKLAATWRSRH